MSAGTVVGLGQVNRRKSRRPFSKVLTNWGAAPRCIISDVTTLTDRLSSKFRSVDWDADSQIKVSEQTHGNVRLTPNSGHSSR
jgi:hypothetical protein